MILRPIERVPLAMFVWPAGLLASVLLFIGQVGIVDQSANIFFRHSCATAFVVEVKHDFEVGSLDSPARRVIGFGAEQGAGYPCCVLVGEVEGSSLRGEMVSC